MTTISSKDNFSERSDQYALFRPSYPMELFEWLFKRVDQKDHAWDCGTGNGQVAGILATAFQDVYATDISENQLKMAIQKDNIRYRMEPAEKCSAPAAFFDLITVAQAIHWFHFDSFYKEVYRTLKPGGVFAVLGYTLPEISKPVDALLERFYNGTIGSYWDTERNYIDAHYKTIPFPFKELETPFFSMTYSWDLDRFCRFLQTWSAVKHYMKAGHADPVLAFKETLQPIWPGGETKVITFPVLFRAGKLIIA